MKRHAKDSFLGDEWIAPLLEDSLRFKATGELHPLGLEREHGEMAWIEADRLEYGYPALHELVVNLHALTFELNRKEPGLRLRQPFQGEAVVCGRQAGTEGAFMRRRLSAWVPPGTLVCFGGAWDLGLWETKNGGFGMRAFSE